jgi:putative MFS transporter
MRSTTNNPKINGGSRLSLAIYSTFSLLSAFSPGPAMLVVTRFFAGLGIGAEPPIADSYLSDLLPPRNRGRYIAWAYTSASSACPRPGSSPAGWRRSRRSASRVGGGCS